MIEFQKLCLVLNLKKNRIAKLLHDIVNRIMSLTMQCDIMLHHIASPWQCQGLFYCQHWQCPCACQCLPCTCQFKIKCNIVNYIVGACHNLNDCVACGVAVLASHVRENSSTNQIPATPEAGRRNKLSMKRTTDMIAVGKWHCSWRRAGRVMNQL